MSQPEWATMTDDEMATCGESRGPKSTVFCEKPAGVHHTEHAGRGKRGQWFFWNAVYPMVMWVEDSKCRCTAPDANSHDVASAYDCDCVDGKVRIVGVGLKLELVDGQIRQIEDHLSEGAIR